MRVLSSGGDARLVIRGPIVSTTTPGSISGVRSGAARVRELGEVKDEPRSLTTSCSAGGGSRDCCISSDPLQNSWFGFSMCVCVSAVCVRVEFRLPPSQETHTDQVRPSNQVLDRPKKRGTKLWAALANFDGRTRTPPVAAKARRNFQPRFCSVRKHERLKR